MVRYEYTTVIEIISRAFEHRERKRSLVHGSSQAVLGVVKEDIRRYRASQHLGLHTVTILYEREQDALLMTISTESCVIKKRTIY